MNFSNTTFDMLTQQQKEAASSSAAGIPKSPEVVYSEQLYNIYRSETATWRTQLELNWDYYLGAQLKVGRREEIERRGQTAHIVNFVAPRVDTAVSMLTSNNPRFTATGREDSDTKTAKMFADLMAYTWERSSGTQQLKHAIKDYYIGGVGYLLTYFDPNKDYGKGEVCYRTVDPRKVFVDPNSKELFWDDAAHVLIVDVLTYEQLQNSYPQFSPILDIANNDMRSMREATGTVGLESQGSSYAPQGRYASKYLVIDRYSKVKVPKLHAYEPISGYEDIVTPPNEQDQQAFQEFLMRPVVFARFASGQEAWYVDRRSADDALKFMQSYGPVSHSVQLQDGSTEHMSGSEEMEHPEGVVPIPGSTVTLAQLYMKDAVDAGAVQLREILVDRIKRTFSIGQVLAYESILETEHYPITPLINNFDRTVVPTSDVTRVRGLQEYINNIRSLIVAHAALTTNFKIAYPQSGYNEKDLVKRWKDRGNPFIPYDAELGNGLVPIAPPPLPNELYKNYEDAKQDIDNILGIYAVMDGNANDAPSTYKGTVALDEYGQRRIKSKKDDVEAVLNRVATVTVQFLQAYYTEYKVIRILRPNGKTETLAINTSKVKYEDVSEDAMYKIHDITVGRYDVVCVSGSMLPANRWAVAEYYKELYKEGLLDREEVLKKTDVADVEGVLQRIGEINMLQQQVAQLVEENKKISGDLQTAQRESVTANKKVEVAQFEKELHKQRVKVEAATAVYNERLKDEITNHAKELKLQRREKETKSRK